MTKKKETIKNVIIGVLIVINICLVIVSIILYCLNLNHEKKIDIRTNSTEYIIDKNM